MHEVLVNHLSGLSLSRKSVVRLTDHPIDVYRGRKTTTQQLNLINAHALISKRCGLGAVVSN